MKDSMSACDLPDDLTGAKRMIEEHNMLKKRIVSVPVEGLDAEGQVILQRINDGAVSSAMGRSLGKHSGKLLISLI